jgi:Uma2 family endonuclease
MNAVAEKVEYTPEDLLALPDEKSYELVDGQLVERNMSTLSSWVGGRIYRLLSNFADPLELGFVWPADNGIQCFPHDPRRVRRPDVSFVRSERLPGGLPLEGWLRVAPDLVVEVLSPNDLAVEVDEKLDDYLKARVPLIWVVNPETRSVSVYSGGDPFVRLGEDGELTGGDVLPGFRCRVSDLFPKPAPSVPGGEAGATPG